MAAIAEGARRPARAQRAHPALCAGCGAVCSPSRSQMGGPPPAGQPPKRRRSQPNRPPPEVLGAALRATEAAAVAAARTGRCALSNCSEWRRSTESDGGRPRTRACSESACRRCTEQVGRSFGKTMVSPQGFAVVGPAWMECRTPDTPSHSKAVASGPDVRARRGPARYRSTLTLTVAPTAAPAPTRLGSSRARSLQTPPSLCVFVYNATRSAPCHLRSSPMPGPAEVCTCVRC